MPNSRFWIHWIDQIGYLTKTRAVDSKFGACWFRWEKLCHLRVLLCNYNGLKHNSFILLCVILSLKECTVKFSWSLSMRSVVGFCVWLSFPVTAICHHHRNTQILGECESHTGPWGGSWSLVIVGHRLDIMTYSCYPSYRIFLSVSSQQVIV
jgi:hypothetical protein